MSVRSMAISPEGLQLLDEYVASHVFLHDDFDPTYPIDDWEGYDTAPLLLGGETIAYENPVLDSAFLSGLTQLGFAAQVHFLAKRPPSVPLAEAIAMDSEALARLIEIGQRRRVSVFENRPAHEG